MYTHMHTAHTPKRRRVMQAADEELAGGRTDGVVTSVCLSSCGNFGLVGSAAGRIDR